MAGRPKKDTTASTSTKTASTKKENAVVDTQTQLLKELQEQLAKLQAENEALKQQKEEKGVATTLFISTKWVYETRSWGH